MILLVSASMLVRNDGWRAVEATLVAQLLRGVLGMPASSPAGSPIVVLTDPQPYGLLVTTECTSGFLIGVLGLVIAPLLLVRRLASGRTAVAWLIAGWVILGTNLVRLGWTALAIRQWGLEEGLRIGHDLVGTLISTVGTSLSGVIALAVILPRARWRRAAHPEAG